jgi:glycosyltransferase involved in cell wall biosynthesis
MKILHVIDSGGFYGAEKMLHGLALAQHDHLDVSVLSNGTLEEPTKAVEQAFNATSVHCVQWRMKAGLNIKGGFEILKFAKQQNVDIIHSHGYKFNIIFGFLSLFRRTPKLVSTVHGYIKKPRFTSMWLNQLMDKFFLRCFDHVCLVSPHMRSINPFTSMSNEKVSVVINGISPDYEPTGAARRSADKREATGLKMLFVGRLSAEKRILELIQTLDAFHSNGKAFSLDVFGEGPLHGDIEAYLQHSKMSELVKLKGYVDNPSQYMTEYDALLMNSESEGVPITILEAMRAEICVVSTAVGGIPTLLGKNCSLLASDSIAQPLKTLFELSKEDRRAIGIENGQRFLGNFTVDAMRRGYDNVYQRLLS